MLALHYSDFPARPCPLQCEFKQVFGNLHYCVTSGQAHVCDNNCSQRIFYDNHTDICRLSRRLFPRGAGGDDTMTDGGGAALARKRSGEGMPAEDLLLRQTSAKRSQSGSFTWEAAAAAVGAAGGPMAPLPAQQQQPQPQQHPGMMAVAGGHAGHWPAC